MRIIFPDVPPLMVIGFLNDKDLRISHLKINEIQLESDEPIKDFSNLELAIFDLPTTKYNKFKVNNCKLINTEATEFSYIYTIEFSAQTNEKILEYIEKILKIQEFAKENSNGDLQRNFYTSVLADGNNCYPCEKDSEFHKNYNDQIQDWFNFNISEEDNEAFKKLAENIELSFYVNNHKLYKQFIEEGAKAFIDKVLKEKHIENHGIFKGGFKRVYIGNEFCPHLLPSCNNLVKMLDISLKEDLKVTIALPYVTQDKIEYIDEILSNVQNWCVKNNVQAEVIANDWAVVNMVNTKFFELQCILGRLMNKRKKDPRAKMMLAYKKYEKEMTENNLNSSYYRDFLNSNNLYRFEFEDNCIDNKIPQGLHSLHFPFYQITTSAFCRTYSESEFFNKYKQKLVESCPHYCDEFCFLYPKHLNMIGKGNSVFGFSNRLFIDVNYLCQYIQNGIDRIVFSAE